MKNINSNEKLFINIFLFLIVVVGIYFCFIGGYGSDEDTLPMIYVFEAKLHDGRFVSSRFTGNPAKFTGISPLYVPDGLDSNNFLTLCISNKNVVGSISENTKVGELK